MDVYEGGKHKVVSRTIVNGGLRVLPPWYDNICIDNYYRYRYEIKSVRAASYIRGVTLSFIMFTTRCSIFTTILAYILLGNNVNAEQVFVLTAFYNILRQSMTVFFPQGISQVAEGLVSINRLNQFLLYDEAILTLPSSKGTGKSEKVNGFGEKFEGSSSETADNAVTICNATARWTEGNSDNTFTNINLNVKRGSLIAIIGPVGSGKTSLLHAVLKELPLISGSINVSGEVSYASQEPWLFAGSVRTNILFGQAMDKHRYKKVSVVMLLSD